MITGDRSSSSTGTLTQQRFPRAPHAGISLSRAGATFCLTPSPSLISRRGEEALTIDRFAAIPQLRPASRPPRHRAAPTLFLADWSLVSGPVFLLRCMHLCFLYEQFAPPPHFSSSLPYDIPCERWYDSPLYYSLTHQPDWLPTNPFAHKVLASCPVRTKSQSCHYWRLSIFSGGYGFSSRLIKIIIAIKLIIMRRIKWSQGMWLAIFEQIC